MREHRHRHHDDEDVVFMKFRHRDPRGFGPGGPFPGPFGPGGFGPGGFGPGGPGRRGRRRRGDVRLALLMLLKLEGPRNGYQLMQALEERSQGRWRPSPGSVYPALSQLEDEGLISSTQVEGESGRTFALTPAGEEHLDERGDVQAPWEPQNAADDAIGELRHAVVATIRAVRQIGVDGNAEQIAKATELLGETRRALYRLLAGDDEA
ncbi:MAG TPA: PadR family transcriptional regulator [Solirubrobacteraceae bacterium]|nr:PadR family transcriptional regulator [Solirubrobacteraceae bacterium]